MRLSKNDIQNFLNAIFIIQNNQRRLRAAPLQGFGLQPRWRVRCLFSAYHKPLECLWRILPAVAELVLRHFQALHSSNV